MARRPRPVGSAPRAAFYEYRARCSEQYQVSDELGTGCRCRARHLACAPRKHGCPSALVWSHTKISLRCSDSKPEQISHASSRGGGLRVRAALATPACQSAVLQGAARSRKKRFTQSVVSAVRGGRGRHGPSTSVARCGTTPHTARSEDAGTSKYSSSGCAAHVNGVPKRGLLSTVLAASAGHLREGVCAIGDS